MRAKHCVSAQVSLGRRRAIDGEVFMSISTQTLDSAGESRKRCIPFFCLFLLSLVVGVVSLRWVPFAIAMPGYWTEAHEFASTGKIACNFIPLVYPAMLGEGIRLFGETGACLIQFIFYLLIVLSAYAILRLGKVKSTRASICAAVIALSPDLISGIKKIWDIEASCFALLILLASLMLWQHVSKRSGKIWGVTLLVGVVWGVGIAIRPNFSLLLLPILYLFWEASKQHPRRIYRVILLTAVTLCLAVTTEMGLNVWAHGSYNQPHNGSYNFFAGANSYTESSILSSENAEPSIPVSFRPRGYTDEQMLQPSPDLLAIMMREGVEYVKQHPIYWGVRLSSLKLFTILRPDTKNHGLFSPVGLVRLVVCLAPIVWIALLLQARLRGQWSSRESFAVLVFLAYCLPFMLTNGDPRFGAAIDLYLWINIAQMLFGAREVADANVEGAAKQSLSAVIA